MPSVSPTMLSVHFQNGKTTKGLKYCHCTLVISNLYSERYKSKAWSCYIITSIDGEWYFIKKFSGRQICAIAHIRWRRQECYCILCDIALPKTTGSLGNFDEELEDLQQSTTDPLDILPILSEPARYNLESTETPLLLEWIMIQSKIRRKLPDKNPKKQDQPRYPVCNWHFPKYLKDYVLTGSACFVCFSPLSWFSENSDTHTHTKRREKKKKGCSNISIG